MAFVVALFDYGEGAAFGTPFREGDVFRLIEKSNEEWWKVERKDKKIMYVPKKFVEVRDLSSLPGSPRDIRSRARDDSPSNKLMRTQTQLAMTASSGVRSKSASDDSPSLPPRRFTVSHSDSPTKKSHSVTTDPCLTVDDSLDFLHKRAVDACSRNSLILAMPLHKKNVALPGGKKCSSRNWIQLYCVLVEGHLLFYKDRKVFEKSRTSGSMRKKATAEKDLPTSEFQLECSILQVIRDHKRKHVVELMNEKNGVVWCQLETQGQFDEFKKVILSHSGAKEVVDSSSNGHAPESVIADDDEDDDDKKIVKKKLLAFFSRRPPLESLQGLVKEQYFGVHLDRLCEREKCTVPTFVEEIISAIEQRGLETVGIYRLSGNASQVQKIRFMVDQEEEIDYTDALTWDDINVLTGALKLFLRELPEPLIPYPALDSFVNAVQMPREVDKRAAMHSLIEALPQNNFDTLKFILEHLMRVTALGDENKMQVQNIAIVFGPTMMRKEIESINLAMEMVFRTSIVDFMLRDFHSLFS
ncbi:rho GTPase-activating protein 15-like isoform X2 [Sycon ciliatum]|uniref:rho GTPase-activating protein 15-like isoform X2 n=1 Tax=Sycon ciliatum TaxID=27933 RepID=UPI0031F61BE8